MADYPGKAAIQRYDDDADFYEKVEKAFAAVEASSYSAVKRAVLAIALDAALPPE